MSNKRTKKQHYIPKTALKIFFDNENIYEKNIKTKRIYKTSVSNTMCMANIYEIDELDDNLIEKLFASSVDNDIPKHLKNIIYYLENENYLDAKTILFNYIKVFVINYYRSLANIKHYSMLESKITNESKKRMFERVFNIAYIQNICTILVNCYNFAFIKSSDGGFFLSDQYISTCALMYKFNMLNLSNREIGLSETMVLIPISRYYYAVFYAGKLPGCIKIKQDTVNLLDDNEQKVINRVIYCNSMEKCLSTSEICLYNSNQFTKNNGDSPVFVTFKNGMKRAFNIKKRSFP